MFWLDLFVELFPALVDVRPFTRRRSKCPQCGSDKVRLTGKKPLGMRTFNYHASNLNAAMPLVYGVTYRCSQCQATWHKTITESR